MCVCSIIVDQHTLINVWRNSNKTSYKYYVQSGNDHRRNGLTFKNNLKTAVVGVESTILGVVKLIQISPCFIEVQYQLVSYRIRKYYYEKNDRDW